MFLCLSALEIKMKRWKLEAKNLFVFFFLKDLLSKSSNPLCFFYLHILQTQLIYTEFLFIFISLLPVNILSILVPLDGKFKEGREILFLSPHFFRDLVVAGDTRQPPRHRHWRRGRGLGH